MQADQGVMAVWGAVGTVLGTALGAFGMKRRYDVERGDLTEEIKRLSERIIRLEEQIDNIREERGREREASERMVSRMDAMAATLSRIEAVFTDRRERNSR